MLQHVYCISLKDNARREFMKPQLEKFFYNKYTIIDAITPENKETKEYKLPEKNKFRHLSEVAICFSHLKCLKDIYEKKMLFGAIIEDDIHLREDYNDALNKMIKNSPNVLKIMEEEPCIIHLVSNPCHNGNTYTLREFPRVINICFYVINHMFAKILLENDFDCPFDQFIYFMINKYKI